MINSKHIFGATLLTLLTFCLCGCSDKDDGKRFDLRMGSQSYEVREGTATVLEVISGNGDYALEIDNGTIISATLVNGNGNFGSISILGKKKGKTTLSITDKATQQTIKVSIKVTDFYLPLVVSSSNHPALIKDMRIFLVANNNKDVYFFLEEKKALILRQKGSYELISEKQGEVENQYLLLQYAADDKGSFTDAAIAPTVHKFDLAGGDPEVYKPLTLKLTGNLKKASATQTKSSPVSLVYVNLKEVGKDYNLRTYIGFFNWQDYIPEGILD